MFGLLNLTEEQKAELMQSAQRVFGNMERFVVAQERQATALERIADAFERGEYELTPEAKREMTAHAASNPT